MQVVEAVEPEEPAVLVAEEQEQIPQVLQPQEPPTQAVAVAAGHGKVG